MSRIFHGFTVRSVLLSGVAICMPIAVQAQDASSTPETVVVTGSLISRPGFQAPTPVTAVSASDLETAATTTLADTLNMLPQFGAPTTNDAGFQGGGSGGANYINLRNLGAIRTLVLFNGERTVASSLNNSVDLNTLPTTLIQSVDVVTGGASATYGSDAVAGVVNIVLNKNFSGLKFNAEYSNNGQNEYEGYKADAAFGTDFADGRGHIEGSLSYFDNPQFYLLRQTNWNTSTALFKNPAYTSTNGQPEYIHENWLGQATEAQGGVITSGPFANTLFVGPNATPTLYAPGIVSGTIASGGNADQSFLLNTPVGLPQHGYNAFAYGSYKITPSINAHLELDYGVDGGSSAVEEYQSVDTIYSGNPYIPALIQSQMTAMGVASIPVGTNNINLGGPEGVVYPNRRALERGTLGFDGVIGDWSWSAYYEHGETHTSEHWENNVYIPNYNNAINAVVAPAGNSAGIAAGTIVCASTLTNPTNGCAPLDVFGQGTASQAAINYITLPNEFTAINNKQDVASFSVQGEPLSDWAGPISVAGGADYRSESAVSYSNPTTYQREYAYGNALPFEGAINVYEGYAETVVPLARNEWWAQSMDFNAAGRVTDYSTSGVVETWKLGATNQITDEYRLRATWSTDIRAPNVGELFTQAVSGRSVVTDLFTGTSAEVLTTTIGNRNLKPEDAMTVSGGVVFTPNWLPGLSASFDWYSIDIHGAIQTVSAGNELTFCYDGETAYCGLLQRNSAGVLTQIFSTPTNTAAQTTSGLDVEAGYTHELWGGAINLRALANYMDENTIFQNGISIDNAGSLSASTLVGAGPPKFKATLTSTYNWDAYSATIQTRLIGASHIVNGYTSAIVDNNSVPFVGYLDLRGSYNLSANWQFYFAMDNVLDTPPPAAPQLYSTGSAYYVPDSPGTVYDLLGRVYRVGVRANF